MRVLLFAPVAGRDPLSGDTTYTEILLRHPPPGVEYMSYDAALKDGAVTVRGRKTLAMGSAVDAGLLAVRAAERLLRGHVLYREPWWFVSVEPHRFDIIHSHLFAVRQLGQRVPVVSTAGYPRSEHYRARDGWSLNRLRRADNSERFLGRSAGVHIPGYTAPPGDLLTVYTEHFRQWVIDRGQAPSTVRVIGQALNDEAAAAVVAPAAHPRLGFIGRDFHRKGGDVALEAWTVLRRRHPDVTLVVVTAAAALAGVTAEQPGVSMVLDATRQHVVEQILPSLDVLLAPTRADCGVPYGILEAIRAGCGVVMLDNPWLDRRLAQAGNVRLVASTRGIVPAVMELLAMDPEHRRRLAADALARLFSLDTLHEQLLSAYSAVAATA